MTFNLENAVQQGFNRDVATNDFNVEANSLEIILGTDNNGNTTDSAAMFTFIDGYS